MFLRLSLVYFTFSILFLYLVYDCDANNAFEGKIVGGDYTKISRYAHATFLSMTCGEVGLICGASVVNQRILLTAAHCLSECTKKLKVHAFVGHEDLQKVKVVRSGSSIAVHRDYSDETLANDIALVHLAKKLPLGKYIKRVILKKHYSESDRTSVAGWGITNDATRERTILLKAVDQTLRPQEICDLIGHLRKGMLCAGDPKNSENRPSKGDSGSALITSEYQQIGIVSFRNEKYLGLLVYTDVSHYYEWILRTSKKLYCLEKET